MANPISKWMDKRNAEAAQKKLMTAEDAKKYLGTGYAQKAASDIEKHNQQLKEVTEARKRGGPVKKGKKYIVGEKGPELFIPKKIGKIV